MQVLDTSQTTRQQVRRDFQTFARWAALAVGRAWGQDTSSITTERLQGIWCYANRNIAARLATCCIRDGVLRRIVRGDIVVLDLPGRPSLPIKGLSGFGLPIANLDGKRHKATEDPVLLCGLVAPLLGLDTAAEAQLREHLVDSSFNLALALLARELRDQLSKRDIHDPRVSVAEQFVTHGHPLDPLCRDRLGLHLRENLLYGPEQLARAPVHAIDVRKDMVSTTAAFNAITWGLFDSPEDGWVRIPVHATLLRQLPSMFPRHWGKNLKSADAIAQPGQALVGMGTVRLQPRLAKVICLELAGNGTSEPPVKVRDRARVSMVLSQVRKSDPILRDGPELIRDRGGASLDRGRLGPRAAELDVVVRESANAHTPEKTKAWVCAALGERWPGRYETLLDHACAGYPGTARQHGEFFLGDYLRRFVKPVLRWACAHGIALDVGLTRSLLLVKDGRPSGFLVRELGQACCYRPRFEQAGHSIDLDASSGFFAPSLEVFQARLARTLFEEHLGSLFGWIEEELGLAPSRSWDIARQFVAGCFEEWSSGPTRLAAREDHAAFLGPELALEPILAPHLPSTTVPAALVRLQNPLHAEAESQAA